MAIEDKISEDKPVKSKSIFHKFPRNTNIQCIDINNIEEIKERQFNPFLTPENGNNSGVPESFIKNKKVSNNNKNSCFGILAIFFISIFILITLTANS